MSKEDKFEMDGIVTKVLPGTKFEVTLEGKDHVITCTPSGKIRKNNVKIILGDKVAVSITPYDLNRGIVTWRYR